MDSPIQPLLEKLDGLLGQLHVRFAQQHASRLGRGARSSARPPMLALMRTPVPI